MNNKGLRSFLENDRNVLRFVGVWDNTKSFGGDRQVYAINYYVADDTIEVRRGTCAGRATCAALISFSRRPFVRLPPCPLAAAPR